jgi:hypothetical protein
MVAHSRAWQLTDDGASNEDDEKLSDDHVAVMYNLK